MKNASPLRYPGGKGKISDLIKNILLVNSISKNYVEPFAGGSGVALNLLLSNQISNIYLNDKDKSIYAFWYSILNHYDDFIELILTTEVTVSEFVKQKQIQKDKDQVSILKLGFSSFFLNRTTRSGIIQGGVIGGLLQTGNYPITARFNKVNLIKRIQKIYNYKEKIHLYNLDAIDFMDKIVTTLSIKDTLVYLDPPYYKKGKQLYMNFYEDSDHRELCKVICELQNYWLLSYDNVPEIQQIYKNIKQKYRLKINYSAGKKLVGTEILFTQDNLIIPKDCKKLLEDFDMIVPI